MGESNREGGGEVDSPVRVSRGKEMDQQVENEEEMGSRQERRPLRKESLVGRVEMPGWPARVAQGSPG